KYASCPTVGTFHTYFDFNAYYRIFGPIAQNYLNKLDRIVCVGEAGVRAMRKYVRFDARVIPNGVDFEWFSRAQPKMARFRDSRPTILFVGRLDPRNGLDFLLKALEQVARTLPDVRLVVVGDGPLRKTYEKRAGARLGGQVVFEGPATETRPQYYASADVCCFPAEISNSSSVTLLEALAA